MSTGYGWEGLRQVCVMLLSARHVPERLCDGRYNKMFDLYLYLLPLCYVMIMVFLMPPLCVSLCVLW